jgi:hypothetical protein
VPPDGPRRPLGTLALAAAALGLAVLPAGVLALAMGRLGWFGEPDPWGFLLNWDVTDAGRAVRLAREGGAAFLVVDAYPGTVTCAFPDPDPRLDTLRPGGRAAVGGRCVDVSPLAPRLADCRLLLLPADFDVPDPPGGPAAGRAVVVPGLRPATRPPLPPDALCARYAPC